MALLGDITLYYYDLQSLITQTCALLYYIILYYINLIINNKHYLKRTFFFYTRDSSDLLYDRVVKKSVERNFQKHNGIKMYTNTQK